jgi:AdoMet-dependent heme synthase
MVWGQIAGVLLQARCSARIPNESARSDQRQWRASGIPAAVTSRPSDESDKKAPDMTLVIPAVAGTRDPWDMDFNRAPFLVIWETTRACALACVHCRADAIARRDPLELSTDDALRLIDQVRAFGVAGTGYRVAGSLGSNPKNPEPATRYPVPRPPLFVLTGGDPMRRPDLIELVRYASSVGLTVALTPSGTAAATPARLAELKDAGLSRIAVSLDGPTPEAHDAFRRVRGSYAWTMRIIESAIDLGLPLQINSTISRLTLADLPAMAKRVAELPVTLWALFFLIQTGRGSSLEQISADECERVLNFLYDLSLTAPFGIKTTEAPHYQRIVWQREHKDRVAGSGYRVPGSSGSSNPENPLPETRNPVPNGRRQLRAPRSVNDGNGFVFIDHVGNICPSGFLPVQRGNVRTTDLGDVYRDDEVFVRLRNEDALMGKCGRCRFRAICGGSRSRAFAATGAVMASDPLCAYDPGEGIEPVIPCSSELASVSTTASTNHSAC